MPDLIEQLHRYGEAAEHAALTAQAEPATLGSPRRHRRAGRPLATAAAAIVVVCALVVVVFVMADDSIDVATQDAGMVFSDRTGVVLVFSDGLDGVLAIDLDDRVAARRGIDGARAGDQPYRLTFDEETEHLIVGWGEIHAVPLFGGPSTLIDRATIFLPDGLPGQVWTLDYPGVRIGAGTPTLRRVDTAGEILVSVEDFDATRYEPLIGVPGGLAVATEDAIAIWDSASESIGEQHQPRPTVAASNGTQLAWCGQTCDDPQVIDLAHHGNPTPQYASSGRNLVYSPDGEHLAYLAPGDAGHDLVIHTVESSTRTIVASGLDELGSIQWAPSGDQLFYATRSYQESSLTVGRYQRDTGTWEERHLPVGGGLGFIVLDRSAAEPAFLPDTLVSQRSCPAPRSFPSGRTSTCGFKF